MLVRTHRDHPTDAFHFRRVGGQHAHSGSDAVAAFEAVYTPHLVGGPVAFTGHDLVADDR